MRSILILSVVASYCATSQAELIHHFPLTTDLRDVVGDARGTTHNGAAIRDGYLSLDGVDDFVQLSKKIVPLSGSYSVSMLVRQTNSKKAYMEFISQGVSRGPGLYIGVAKNGGIRVGDDWNASRVLQFPSDGKVHHIVLVVDSTAGESRLYLDGRLSARLDSAIKSSNRGNDTRLGRQYEPYKEFFAGQIGDLRVYNHALTTQEISNALTGLRK